jgi:hypothetical protein
MATRVGECGTYAQAVIVEEHLQFVRQLPARMNLGITLDRPQGIDYRGRGSHARNSTAPLKLTSVRRENSADDAPGADTGAPAKKLRMCMQSIEKLCEKQPMLVWRSPREPGKLGNNETLECLQSARCHRQRECQPCTCIQRHLWHRVSSGK